LTKPDLPKTRPRRSVPWKRVSRVPSLPEIERLVKKASLTSLVCQLWARIWQRALAEMTFSLERHQPSSNLNSVEGTPILVRNAALTAMPLFQEPGSLVEAAPMRLQRDSA
jgi:hypothetical protein